MCVGQSLHKSSCSDRALIGLHLKSCLTLWIGQVFAVTITSIMKYVEKIINWWIRIRKEGRNEEGHA